MFFPLVLSLLQVASLVNGAYTPRSIHARHAAILRARAPAPVPAPVIEPALPVIKKRDSKKCRVRPTTSTPLPSSTQVAPVNPGGDPNSSTSSPTQAPPPPPTTTHHQQQPSPSPTSSGGGNSGSGSGGGNDPFGNFFPGVQTGELTYYALGLTACGQTFSDSDMVAAVSHSLFDKVPGQNGNPNDNPICGKKIKITYQGVSIVVSIEDRCTGCAETDIDLSPSAFSQLASQSLGRLFGATWEWA